MSPDDPRKARAHRVNARSLVCCAVLSLGVPVVHAAGWLDSLFGKGTAQTEAARAGPAQRVWRIREFTTIALAPRENGSADNRQPAQLAADALRQQLSLVQSVEPNGSTRPLFGADELAELAEPLSQALGRAGPADDVLLVSASRRDAGILFAPTAVTARLFMQGDQLQLIVHDAHFDFYDTYRGTNELPHFSFGSRTVPAGVSLRSAGASNTRADWLSIPMAGAPARAGASLPAEAMPAPVPHKPLDAAGAEDLERRLETLKRLREKGLISEEEYQQKRREILMLL